MSLYKKQRKWEDSSLHGPPLVVKSSSVMEKSFWIIICMLSLVMFGYEARAILIQYNEDKIAVTIKTKSPTQWPKVLFCPEDWIDERKLDAFNVTLDLKCFILGSMSVLTNTIDEFLTTKCVPSAIHFKKVLQSFQESMLGKLDWSTLFDKVSYNVDDLFYAHPDSYIIDKDIQYKGVCFNITFTNPFLLFGDAGKPTLYLKQRLGTTSDEGKIADSIFLYDTLDTMEFLDMPRIKTSESPLILIKEEEYVRVQSKEFKCGNSSNYIRMRTTVACVERGCENLGFLPPLTPGYNNGTPMTLDKYSNYLNPSRHCYAVNFTVGFNIIRNCFEDVTPPCKSVSYQFSTYSTNNPKFLRSAVRRVPVITFGYYNSWSSQRVTEFQMNSWDSLVCNLGGMLSLFTGASLLSLVQLLILMVPTCSTSEPNNVIPAEVPK